MLFLNSKPLTLTLFPATQPKEFYTPALRPEQKLNPRNKFKVPATQKA